ncbi:MAG: polysaccharide ABC transporter ATP-binding protein [Planctomycetota bacterium]
MSDQPAIVVENLSKMYHKRAGTGTLLSMIPGFRPRESDEFWALKDVSFEVKRGECLGIIGPNGAGKSTILKILSKITSPTSGSFRVNGRVSSLIEVGAGFHPELTGRENVYLNAAILGMGKSEIESKFDQIVDFSELWDFIDVPVKRYSSGMRVRLGFSVAAHVDPEILLVDEVLAVGDEQFRAKCYDLISRRRTESAVILVSHNMVHIQRICSTALFLRQGRVADSGAPNAVVTRYLESLDSGGAASSQPMRAEHGAELIDVRVHPGDGWGEIAPGCSLDICLTLDISQRLTAGKLYLHVMSSARAPIASAMTDLDDVSGRVRLRFRAVQLPLAGGKYTLSVLLSDQSTGRQLIWHQCGHSFVVHGERALSGAPCRLLGEWSRAPAQEGETV